MYKKFEQVAAATAALSWTTSAITLGAEAMNKGVAEHLEAGQ